MASGTHLQLNGSAYGKGIYLSQNAALSFNYSHGHGYQEVPGRRCAEQGCCDAYLWPQIPTVLAICEGLGAIK